MDKDQDEQLTVAELTVWIEKRQSEQVVLKLKKMPRVVNTTR